MGFCLVRDGLVFLEDFDGLRVRGDICGLISMFFADVNGISKVWMDFDQKYSLQEFSFISLFSVALQ